MFSKYNNSNIIDLNQTLFHDFFSYPNNPEELFTPLYLLYKSEKCEIYKAIYNITREIFCIKKFSSENFSNSNNNSSKNFYDKIKEETTLMKSIKHCEYILHYHGSYFSFETKNIYLIYEYIDGGSIFDFGTILNRNFTEIEIALIINDILHGLIYLHQLNITNNNIKITNILLTKEGNAKIGNFEKAFQKLNTNKDVKDIDEKQDFKYDILLIAIICLEMFIGIKNNFDRIKFLEQIESQNNKSYKLLDINKLLQIELDKIKSVQISNEFKDFLIKCLEPNSIKRPTAFEVINHSFIKNNINEIYKNKFSILVKNSIEKIENYKKLLYQNDNFKNINNNLKISSFYKSKKSNTKNTLKSQITLNEKSSINNTFDNKSYIDKLAEFRIEKMIKNEIIENDKYTSKDLYSNLDNSSINTDRNNNYKENEIENENNLDNSSLKENEDFYIDIDFKSKWEHIKNFQDKLKLVPKFSENNINYNYGSHFLKFNTEDEEELKNKSLKKSVSKCDIIKLDQNISHKYSKKLNESSVISLKNSIIPKNTKNKKLILSLRNTITFNNNNEIENKISTRDESLISKNNNFNFDNRKSHSPFKHKKLIIEDNNENVSDGYIIKEYLYEKLDNLFENEKNNKINDIKKQKSEIIKINKLFNISNKKV